MNRIATIAARLFRRTFVAHLCSLHQWPLDLIGCWFLTIATTPAEPYTLLWFVPISAVWMALRLAIARRLRSTALSRAVAMRIKRARAERLPIRPREAFREYFRSLEHWPVDVVGWTIATALVIPADPDSKWIVFIPLAAVWFTIRWAVARLLRRPPAMQS